MSSESSARVAFIEALAQRRAAPSSTNLPLIEESAASEEIRQLFAHYRKQFLRDDLPGILLCFASNAGLLKGMLLLAQEFLFGQSLLSRREKEMLATYLSHQNACRYCADSHGALLGAEGGSSEIICSLQSGELTPERFTNAELALLKFAQKVNAASSAIIRADVEAAMDAGWSEAQVAEVVHLAALFAAFNRIANGFGLRSPYPQGLRDQL